MSVRNAQHAEHKAFRANREVLASSQPLTEVFMTVYVGLYNAVPYWSELVARVEAQDIKRVCWIFVDNNSADETWALVTAWAATTELDVTLVRNAINLGATGSMFVNLDLVDTPWVSFMHQDDIYFPNHFSTLQRAAEGAPPDTIVVFSDMGRASHEGKAMGSAPAPIWLVPDMEPATLFLALLRNHPIPWPSIAVQTDALRSVEGPWHSTAFPDTELTMLLTARGRFVHVGKEIMRYRDNPRSESRSIDNRERGFGATISLFRVFASAEFGVIARGVAPSDRAAFVDAIRNSILSRLGESDRSYLLITAAWERLDQEWCNSEPHVLQRLSAVYSAIGGASAAALLERMAVSVGGTPTEPDAGVEKVNPLALTDSVGQAGLKVGSILPRAYERVGPYLPYKMRRFSAALLIRCITRNRPLSSWHYDWR